MKKGLNQRPRLKAILLTIAALAFIGFVLLPLTLMIADPTSNGNVAIIPIEGLISSGTENSFGVQVINSQTIVEYIKDAEQDDQIKVILLEINSPGGSAVASDEIGQAIKDAKKPVISLIRELGASGGYWIASCSDHIIANRMSITGSIGVTSSYLEFSGLMEKYGVGYERLVAGEYKDIGTPFREMTDQEKELYIKHLNLIHEFFIEEIAENRDLSKDDVRKLATGNVYLGVEALELGLIDQLGNKETAEQYIKDTYSLKEVNFVTYQSETGLLGMLLGVSTDFAYNIGQGLGSSLISSNQDQSFMLI